MMNEIKVITQGLEKFSYPLLMHIYLSIYKYKTSPMKPNQITNASIYMLELIIYLKGCRDWHEIWHAFS